MIVSKHDRRTNTSTSTASGKGQIRRPGMYELDYAKMGARIRQFRKAKGWSQGKLAKKCGISLNFMGNIERGTRRMSMDTFAVLCNALGTDADTLLFGIAKQDGWCRQRG